MIKLQTKTLVKITKYLHLLSKLLKKTLFCLKKHSYYCLILVEMAEGQFILYIRKVIVNPLLGRK